jgi:hypothetical protein
MGAALPVILLVAGYVAAAAAIITAVTYVTVVLVIAAVIATLASAAATYYYSQGDIKNSMLFSGIAIAAGVGGVYVAYLSEAELAATLMEEGTAESLMAAEAVESETIMQLPTYASTVYAGWSEFAKAIQLDLLFKIHQIAYLVSEDYRTMMQKVFNQVSQVSNALGWGSMTLALLFQNVRTSVMDISTTMGTGYDLAEVKWLQTYNELLKDWSNNAKKYESDPHALLWMIANSVERPGYDAKGATTRTVMQGVESALTLVKTTVEGATKIKNDLTKLISDLPAVIRDQWMPEIRKLNAQVDDFIRLNYNPAMKAVDAAFKSVGDDLGYQKKKAAELADRLKRPGKYIAEIETLEPKDRIDDSKTIARVVDYAYGETINDLVPLIETSRKIIDEDIAEGVPPISEITPKTQPRELTVPTATHFGGR